MVSGPPRGRGGGGGACSKPWAKESLGIMAQAVSHSSETEIKESVKWSLNALKHRPLLLNCSGNSSSQVRTVWLEPELETDSESLFCFCFNLEWNGAVLPPRHLHCPLIFWRIYLPQTFIFISLIFFFQRKRKRFNFSTSKSFLPFSQLLEVLISLRIQTSTCTSQLELSQKMGRPLESPSRPAWPPFSAGGWCAQT